MKPVGPASSRKPAGAGVADWPATEARDCACGQALLQAVRQRQARDAAADDDDASHPVSVRRGLRGGTGAGRGPLAPEHLVQYLASVEKSAASGEVAEWPIAPVC